MSAWPSSSYFGRPSRSLLSFATLLSWNISRPSSFYFGRLSSIDEVILFSDFISRRDIVALEDFKHCLALAPATTVRGPAGPPAFEPHPVSRFSSFDFEPMLPRPRRARHMSGSSFARRWRTPAAVLSSSAAVFESPRTMAQAVFLSLDLPLVRLIVCAGSSRRK
jgi:hypothetical protein